MLNQSIRKNQALIKLTINQLVYYLTFQTFLKDACIDKFQNILKLCCQNFNVVTEKGIAPKVSISHGKKLQKALDQGNEYGALLTDLSKAFDCLPHDLIVAKLHTYGFSIESLKLINSYLTERKQRIKMNDQFSSSLDIVVGVLQGSILGPLLLNIFLCDMFLFCNDIEFASYAEANTPYCIEKTSEEVISQLEKSPKSF